MAANNITTKDIADDALTNNFTFTALCQKYNLSLFDLDEILISHGIARCNRCANFEPLDYLTHVGSEYVCVDCLLEEK